MATKRKREDANQRLQSGETSFRKLLSSSMATHDSAELALLHLMEELEFSPSILQQILSEEGLDMSFSRVTYENMAPFVGLAPWNQFTDVTTFELHRSRIPTSLFKSIIEDMDIMLRQYGPLSAHKTEETRSRFLSPIFNRLVAQFGFAFRNVPESLVEGPGRKATSRRIEYCFKVLGAVTILCIEQKMDIDNDSERLNAIAQVIAECQAWDWNNSQQDFSVPVYCILCNGTSFEIFELQGNGAKPHSFSRGCFIGDPHPLRRGLRIRDFTLTENTSPFIGDIRLICETIFDMMLVGYISGLAAFCTQSGDRCRTEGKPRNKLLQWDGAINSANLALEKCREAEVCRRADADDMKRTNAIASDGFEALKHSVELVPTVYETELIMSGWIDKEVERM